MRIATFNLENLGHDRPDDTDDELRSAVLRPQLLRLQADILCLQEINATKIPGSGGRELSGLDALLEETPYADFHRAVTARDGGDGPMPRHNLVILSRWPIARHRQLHHDLVPAPLHRFLSAEPTKPEPEPVGWDRPLLHAEIELDDGRPLHVLNLHLRAPIAAPVPGGKTGAASWATTSAWAEGLFIASLKRAGQALEARLAIDRILDEDPDARILVAGDFNAGSQEAPTRILLADVSDTGSGDLSRRGLVALERTLPEDRRFSVLHAGRRLMLDHLLASRPLLAGYRGMEIHNETLGDEVLAQAAIDASPESYHAPVVATFEDVGASRPG